MKLCPHCEFIYEDDQSLCDMDGAALVHNPVPTAFEENAVFLSPQLLLAPTLETLAAGPAPIPTPGPALSSTPAVTSPPTKWQLRSYAVLAVAGVLLATLLFVIYYARTHRLQSDHANRSQDQSYEQTTSHEPDAQPSPDQSSPSSSLADVSTEQSPAQLLEQSPGPLVSQDLTPETKSTSVSPASEKPVTRARPAPGPVSAAASSATKRAPVVILLTNGASIKADEAWEKRDGIWYRQGGLVTLLKRSRVRAIQRVALPQKSQQPTARLQTSIAQNQPRVGKPETTTTKKESKVSSFLKKTGRILKKPFQW